MAFFARHSLRLGRRGWVIVSLVLLALALVPFVVLPTVVRRVAIEKAEARGVELHIDSVSLGFRRVRLRGVEATLPSPLDGKLSLDEVTLALGFGFEPRAIAATGGRLEMRSDVLALEEALRSRRSGESESEASTSAPLPIEISNLVVDWRGVLPGLVESEVQVNGLELSRHSETLALSVASVTAKLPGLSVEMTELRCQLSRGEPGYALSRFEVRTSRLLVDASEVGRTTEALAAVLRSTSTIPDMVARTYGSPDS
jgi:hypothetical protein